MSRKDRKFKGFFRPKLGDLQKKKKKKKKRSSPKFRVIFRPKSEIQTFFPPKIRWSPKKKKKKKKKSLRQNSELFLGRNPKFKRFFRPKSGDLQKKKKNGLRQNSRRFFSQFRNFKRLRGGYFRMGGAIFHFSQKIGLKTTKNMRFCILHKPMGGLEPPHPPLATLLGSIPDGKLLLPVKVYPLCKTLTLLALRLVVIAINYGGYQVISLIVLST